MTAPIRIVADDAVRRLPWRMFALPVSDGHDGRGIDGFLLAEVWKPACETLTREQVATVADAAGNRAVVTLAATVCRASAIGQLDTTAQAAWLLAEIRAIATAVEDDPASAQRAASQVHPGRDWREQLAAARRQLQYEPRR